MILTTQALAIGYGGGRNRPIKTIASPLNLTLQKGQLVCLLGPNGAGKSTLMRTLAGMQPPLSGIVQLAGTDITTLRPQTLAKQLSIVLTEKVDVGLLSAYALVALGRYPYTDWRGRLSAEDQAVIERAIQMVGAESLANRPVSELSDGERQKVMIARALAQEPQLMLLDEPTAYLDLPRRVEIMQILRRLAHEGDRAVLLSTHDLDLALRNADVVWLLADGQLHIGAPEDLVLDGTFGRAFASPGVTFDAQSGAFRGQQPTRGTVHLIGTGLRATWTVRALERVGFVVEVRERVDRNAASPRIVCHTHNWQLIHANGESCHESLFDLLTHIM